MNDEVILREMSKAKEVIMDKSINLIIDETKEKIMKDIVESKLPAGVMAMILNEITINVITQANAILLKEKAEYQKSLEQK